MWAAQRFKFEEPNRWMTSGGLGTMGYGLPAAIGVQIAHPDSLVIDIAGEASVQMTMQEMSTAVQYNLPVKIFILNNEYMGMVRQWQQLLHGGRYSHSYSEALPDFVKLAEAFGAVGLRAETPDELDAKIMEMIAVRRARCCSTAASTRRRIAIPMIPSGAAHNEMILCADAGRRWAMRPKCSERRKGWHACWKSARPRLRAKRRRSAYRSLNPATESETKIPGYSELERTSHHRRAGGQRGRRAGPRHRPVLRPRLQYRKPDGGRGRSSAHTSRITIVTSGTPEVLEQIKAQLAPPGAGAPRRATGPSTSRASSAKWRW